VGCLERDSSVGLDVPTAGRGASTRALRLDEDFLADFLDSSVGFLVASVGWNVWEP